jgi:flagellar motor protein MotB
MRKSRSLTQNEIEMFGPGTDLIVSLVAVLMIMFAVQDILNFKIVRQNQMETVKEIADAYDTKYKPLGEGLYEISTRSGSTIRIKNDATLQRISFEGDVLFVSGSAKLPQKSRGYKILKEFADIFAAGKKLDIIKEIQIQGHADTRGYTGDKYTTFDNLELAAHRAMEVYTKLKELGIKPFEYVISATSFGKYMPVDRKYEDMEYSKKKLKEQNKDRYMRKRNRRIEIVLIYRSNIKIVRGILK